MKQIKLNKQNYIDQLYKTENTKRYMTDIKRCEILTTLQENEKFQKIRQGDMKAREDIIKAHLRFVVCVAGEYVSSDISLDELIQEGNLGLINAIDKFDEHRGYKFSSFAINHIQAKIVSYITINKRILKCSWNHLNELSRIKKIQDVFLKKHEYVPNSNEIIEWHNDAYKKELSEADIGALLAYDKSHVSIGLWDYIDNNPHYDVNETLEKESFYIDTMRVLDTITPREKDIIILYFGLDGNHALTLEEIGEKFDLTRERVLQIGEKAIRRLQHSTRSSKLKQYLW